MSSCDQEGYISGLDEEDDFPAWEDGILFTIAETDDPEGEAEPPLGQDKGKDTVSFHADKWRSALGAYGLSQCVAVQNDDGLWGSTPSTVVRGSAEKLQGLGMLLPE